MFIRQIVYSKEAAATVDSAIRQLPLAEETMLAVEWILGRAPERGVSLDGIRFAYRTEKMAVNRPIVTVVYTFDAAEVNIEFLWIRP